MAIKTSRFNNDILAGTSGNDILTAEHDTVLLDGGAGNDTYILSDPSRFTGSNPSLSAIIVENANSGTDKVMVDGDFFNYDGFSLQANGLDNIENLSLIGYADYGYGNELNNILDASKLEAARYGGIMLYGAGGNDTITGSLFDDLLYGNAGNDVINGSYGEDGLYAGDGNDILNGGLGNDFFYGGYGNDTINGGDATGFASVNDDYGYGGGNDKMYGQYGNDILNGGNDIVIADAYGASLYAGSDSLYGGRGNDVLNGGNDVLIGDLLSYADTYYGGQDMLYGGYGNDILNGGNHTITGGNFGLDREDFYGSRTDYYGGYGNDIINMANITINGGGGYDVIYGGYSYAAGDHFDNFTNSGAAGNDTIKGGTVTLHGNAGDDSIFTISSYSASEINTLVGGFGNDTITGGKYSSFGDSGNDKIYGGYMVYYGDSDGGESEDYGGSGNDKITGATHLIDGGTGDDYIYAGYSWFYGGAGNDIIIGGNKTITGGTGDDRVYLGANAQQNIFGGYGNDTITAGNLTINLGTGNNHVYGAYGHGYAGYVQLYGFYGNDTLNASNGSDFLNGGYGNDRLNGNNGNDFLFGGYGNDILNGGAGNDILLGGGYGSNSIWVDNDQLIGGAGNDTFYVGLDYGNDTITDASGEDTVFVYGMNFTAPGTIENIIAWDTGSNDQVLTGNTLSNYIYGSAGDDTLLGLGGNDVLDGGNGDDRMEGGTGNDNYIVDQHDDVVIELAGQGTDTVFAYGYGYGYLPDNVENLTLGEGAGSSTIFGNALNNILRGNTGDNHIYGGAGADTLISGGGDDELFGGAGNDIYTVENGNDSVFELNDGGIETVRSNGNFVLGLNVENLILTGGQYGTGFDGTGNALNNRIEGSTGGDNINGGAGNDTMIGGAGSDDYTVDSTGDTVTEAANAGDGDTITYNTQLLTGTFNLAVNVEYGFLEGTGTLNLNGNTLNNLLYGNNAANIIDGGAGNDFIYGGGGNDTLRGGTGNDVIYGSWGSDTMNGGLGNDIISVDRGDGAGAAITTNEDVVSDDGGIDEVVSNVYTYTLPNSIENLSLYFTTVARNGTGNALNNVMIGNNNRNVFDGAGGNDHLYGGNGDDHLYGGLGNDTLDGQSGVDTMNGGAGNDIFIVDNASDLIEEALNEGTDLVRTFVDEDLRYDDDIENLTHYGAADTSYGNTANNVMTGQDNFDMFYGDDGNDTLNGNGGDDSLYGGAGNDVINGGNGSDLMYGDDDNDIINAGTDQSDDILYGGDGNDTMTGGAGNDHYSVDSATDVIIEATNGGDDEADIRSNTELTLTMAANLEDMFVFYGGAYGDEGHNITGNALDNFIGGDYGDNTHNGLGGNDEIWGFHNLFAQNGSGVDILSGGDGNDTLRGGDDNDTLDGGNGNDFLYGGTDNDTMTGGAGDDLFEVTSGDGAGAGTGEDTVIEASGGGTDTVRIARGNNLDYTLNANVENLHFTGTGTPNNTTSVGNTLDNLFTLDQLATLDSFDGGLGFDTMDATLTAASTSGTVTTANFEAINLTLNMSGTPVLWTVDTGNVTGQAITLTGVASGIISNVNFLTLDNIGAGHTIFVHDFVGGGAGETITFVLDSDAGPSDALSFELGGGGPDADGSDVTALRIASANVEVFNFLVRADFNEVFVNGAVGTTEEYNFTGTGTRVDFEGLDAITTLNLTNFTVQTFNVFLAADTLTDTLNLEVNNVVIGDEDAGSFDTDNGGIEFDTINLLVAGTVASFIDGSGFATGGTMVLTGAQDITFRDFNGNLDASGYSGDLTIVNAGTIATFTAGTGIDNVTFQSGVTDMTFADRLNDLDTVSGGDTLTADIGTGTHQLHISDVSFLDFTLTGTGGTYVFDLGEIEDSTNTVDIDLFGDVTANITFLNADFDAANGRYNIDASFLTTGTLTATTGERNDTLMGGGGDDTLNAGANDNTLTGNGGNDTFVFDNLVSGDINTITDFTVVDDTMALSLSEFGGIGAVGAFDATTFQANLTAAAADANDRILYDTDAGTLFYDPDGNGAEVAIQIATLTGLPVLTAADFSVIA